MLRCILNVAKSSVWTENSRVDLKSRLKELNSSVTMLRNLHITTVSRKKEDRKTMYASIPPKDEGTFGENLISIDASGNRQSMFPDETTPDRIFDGIPFKLLPICNVKITPNNTIFTVTDYKGTVKLLHTAGIEGFKHCKKGTNIAAQTAAITISTRAIQEGIKTVRVRLRGLGPGRMASIKGLQLGGFNIISVTDNTHVSWFPPRPRKQRRL